MKLYTLKMKVKKRAVKYLIPEGFYFRHKGYCPCCENNVVFESRSHWLRDYFVCNNCNSIPRERALMVVIDKYYPNWRDLDIHESSPGNRGTSFKLKHNAPKYIASQYFPNEPLGTVVKSWLNQDLENHSGTL